MRYFLMRVVDGSAGAELWSAVTLLALGAIWLTEPPTRGGLLYRVVRFGPASSMLALLMLVGLLHLCALWRPPSLRWVWTRKVCAMAGVTLWATALFQLLVIGQWLTIVSLGLLVALLFVAIGRRTYRYL